MFLFILSFVDVQSTNEGEESPRGFPIDVDFSSKSLLQQAGSVVVQTSPSHIDGFDMRGRSGLHSFPITLANKKIVFE